MMTAYGTSQTSIDAIRAGAFEYLTKPLDLDQLRTVIAHAIAAKRSREQAGAVEGEDKLAPAGVRLVGEVPAMQDVYKMIGRLATNDVPALVLWGDHDEVVPSPVALAAGAAMPRGEVRIAPYGHSLHVEQAAEVGGILKGFLGPTR